MNLGSPVLDVAPAVRGALLQALARLEQPVTRRQLAAAAGVAPGNASAVIEELIQSGLVSESVAGRSSMVVLNRSHLAAGPVLALAGLRGELIRRLRERLSAWPDLHGGWLFGSVARGDADSDSDVDLLIVADDLQSHDLHERLARASAAGRDPARLGSPAEVAQRMLAAVPSVSAWDEQLGPFYDTAGLTRYLGVSKQALADRVKRRRLLAMTTADGKTVYPARQFDGRDLVRGFADILAVFRGIEVDDWTLGSWLMAPSAELDGLSVLGWLVAGRPADVARVHANAAAARWSL